MGYFFFVIMLNKVKPYIEITLAMIFWAASFIWYKEAYQFVGPMTLIFFRLIVATIFLFLLTSLMKRRESVKKSDIKFFLLLALVEPLLYFLGESHGMLYVSSTVGAVIISTIPLFTPFAALAFYKEKISWVKIAGLSISFVGVLLVIMVKGFKLIAPIEGIALMFLAVFAAVGHSVIIVILIKKYRTLTIILGQNLVGALYFLPIFLFTELDSFQQITWNWDVIEPILKLGIFPSSISYIFLTRTIKTIGITRTNVFINFIPVFTAVMSYFILHEEMTTSKVIGILIVLTGLLVTQIKANAKTTLNSAYKRFH